MIINDLVLSFLRQGIRMMCNTIEIGRSMNSILVDYVI